MKSQKKIGVIIQYINIILSFAISIFFTPFLIRSLGDAEYGVYRIIQSFAGQLTVLSFGIATLVARNVVKYNTLNDKKEKENFLATALITSVLLSVVVLFVGFILSFGIDSLFDSTFSVEQLNLARKLYWLLISRIAVVVLTDMATGIITAHEQFAIKNGLTTINYIIRVCVLVVLLKNGCSSVAIVSTDLCIAILIFVAEIIYSFGYLHEKIHFYYLNKEELKISLTFSFAIFLQAIVNQVNQNLDSVILGAMISAEVVTMYSIALSLFTMFNSITMVFGTIFVPQATRLVTVGASGEELTDMVIRPGRMEVIIGNLVITGFILFGRDFIKLWVGEQYLGAYFVLILLMIPAMIPLMQNVTNSILDAMMKRLGRSIIMIVMAVINVLMSIVLIRCIGYIGATIGTAFSYIVGNGILMNIHLKKSTNLNLKRMYKELLSKILIVAVVCLIIASPLMLIRTSGWFILALKIAIYSFIYLGAIYIFGMRDYERKWFTDPLFRITKKFKKRDS